MPWACVAVKCVAECESVGIAHASRILKLLKYLTATATGRARTTHAGSVFAGHASVSDVVFGMACCVVVGTGELVAVKEVTVSVPVEVDSSRSQAQVPVAASAAGGGSPSNANVRHRRHVESSAAASSLTAVTREADLLRSLQHDNIVRCLGTLSGADVPTSSHNLARRQRGDDDGDIDGNAATTTAGDGTASGSCSWL